MKRITERDLEGLAKTINQVAGTPVKTIEKTSAGMSWNIGNYHIDYAYGGVALVQTTSPGGGVRTILSRATKRDLYQQMHAFIYGLEASMKKNPSRRAKKSSRIHRPNIRLTAYVTRPSQITRKKPSKRLVKRRRKVQVRPARGYFPNPSALLIQKHTGKNWTTLLRMPDTPANRKKANYAARSLARKTGLSATVRVIRT